MTILHVVIERSGGELGRTPAAEREALSIVLHNLAHVVARGGEIAHKEHPEPIRLNGLEVGKFWMGPDALSATNRR